MGPNRFLIAAILLSLASAASATINLTIYYGEGCPHCVRTIDTLFGMAKGYNLSIEGKEVYYVADQRQEMFNLYLRFGLDPMESGVPTTLVGNRSLVVGEISPERWKEIFGYCMNGSCREGVFTQNSVSPIEVLDKTKELTLTVLIGAALVDSINPCTLAIMVMLLGLIVVSKGRKEALIAGLAFSATVYVMYFLMGFGVFKMIANTGISNVFYIAVTIASLALAVLEIRAYFYYEPGFASVEIPMFLRPYVKGAISGATSLPGVIFSALLCSVFLLPCSSGPYLMVLGMLAKSATAQVIGYLLVYNLVFILPMLVIALAIYLGKANAERMNELREKHIRDIHLFSGLILLVLFLLMLQQILHL